MKRIVRGQRNLSVNVIKGVPLEPWSSLNDYFMCICGRKFAHKKNLIMHHETCSGQAVACPWCAVIFNNYASLSRHAFYMHGKRLKNPIAKPTYEHKCEVCDASYKQRWRLTFHIRRHHFNLWATIPHADKKQVNEVWFEKVQNTNLKVQITKVSLNTLVMKPAPPNTGIEIHEDNMRIDLRNIYPTCYEHERADKQCEICLKVLRKFNLQTHINETHFNLIKHKCKNCKEIFKRSSLYLRHICCRKYFRSDSVNLVKRCNNNYSCRSSPVDSKVDGVGTPGTVENDQH